MEESIKRILGITDEGKRVYRFVSGEVTQDEFQYCQSLDTLLFGKDGYVSTLGPTWDLIHDPRFSKIENAFIVNHRAVFGGDAMSGKQYISSDGSFTSVIADLDEYSEILGEGRFFVYILTHPDKECPLRNWYLRIFPSLGENQDRTIPTPGKDLVCTCSTPPTDPHSIKDATDETLWALIRQECPNYFTKENTPNGIATRLFDLFRADLLGLIADYALTPISDVFVELDTGDVFNYEGRHETLLDAPNVETPHVFLEVDILEKALTQRAVLRATAAKILRQMNFQSIIKEELGEDFHLTDMERDQLLRLVYNPPEVGGLKFDPGTNWYGFLSIVKDQVIQFLKEIKQNGHKMEERQSEQLSLAYKKAQNTFSQLVSGEVQPINQYTEPEVDVPLDPHAEILQSILKNPLKLELFMIWVEAERLANSGNNPVMSQIYSILTPPFTDPEYDITENEYACLMEKVTELGFFDTETTHVEEEYHGNENGCQKE